MPVQFINIVFNYIHKHFIIFFVLLQNIFFKNNTQYTY